MQLELGTVQIWLKWKALKLIQRSMARQLVKDGAGGRQVLPSEGLLMAEMSST